jgi:glycosyltransferase involved in cell wall biosynthesis
VQRNQSGAKILYLIQGYEPYTQGTLFEGPFWRKIFNRSLALRSYEKVDLRCYVSRAIAAKVGLDSSPCLVHPGLNPAIFFPDRDKSRDDQIRIGMIARSGKLKGTHVFLEAVAQIRDLHPKIHWIILRVGEIPHRLPTNTEVLVAHNDRDMADFYRSLDIFIVPSLYEGFGLPALEAMACDTALITTNVDGAREYAEHEVNSLVVPTGDSGALAEAMRRLVVSPELRKQLALAGLETAKRFTWQQTVDSFETRLKSIGGVG